MNDVAPLLNLIPVNNCVLVQLEKTSLKEGKYDTRTSGVVVASTKSLNDLGATLIEKRVYFEEYKEGARIRKNGEMYCFIKIED